MEKRKLPNATGVLVLGVLSICTFCCYGIFGFVFAIVALVLASNDMKLYNQNPEQYHNYGNLQAGRIMAVVGLVLSTVVLAIFMFFLTMSDEERKSFMENLEAKVEAQQEESDY